MSKNITISSITHTVYCDSINFTMFEQILRSLINNTVLVDSDVVVDTIR